MKQGPLPGDYTIDPNDGFTSQALGRLAAEDWLHGHVPYWNRYEGLGTPLAGEMQSAAMFPLVPLLVFPDGLLYMHVVLEITAGIATFFFLAQLGRSRPSAMLGGCLFALSGTFGWLTNAIFNPIAFLPLIMFALERIRSRVQGDQRLGWGLLGVAVALAAYAGFPEVAFLDLLFVAGWAVLRCLQLPGNKRLAFTLRLGAGGLLGLVLSAPILIPFADYLAQANNAHAEISAGILVNISLFALFMPYIYGPIFGFHSFDHTSRLGLFWGSIGGYLSAGVVALGVVGLAGRRDRGVKAYLALWSLLVCLKIYGFKPVGRAIDLIPGVGPTAFYRYALVSVEFALIVLAMAGLDDLRDGVLSRLGLALGSIAGLGVCAGFTVGARGEVRVLIGAPDHHTWAVASAVAALGVMLLIFGAALTLPRASPWIVSAAVAIETLGLYMVPQFSTPTAAPIDQAPVNFLRSHIGLSRVYSLGPMAPDYGSYFAVPQIDVNDALIPRSWSHYITNDLDPNSNSLVFNGIYQPDPNGPSPAAMLLARLPKYEAIGVRYIFGNPGTLPDNAAQQGVQPVYRDPLFEIWELPAPDPYYKTSDQAACQVTPEGPDRVGLQCASPGVLVRNAQFMPGWKATINGRPVAISAKDSLLQQVNVPAGASLVSFAYVPPYMREAWLLFAVAICGFILLWLLPRLRASHSQPRARSTG